jgi:hypothetical protein
MPRGIGIVEGAQQSYVVIIQKAVVVEVAEQTKWTSG